MGYMIVIFGVIFGVIWLIFFGIYVIFGTKRISTTEGFNRLKKFK